MLDRPVPRQAVALQRRVPTTSGNLPDQGTAQRDAGLSRLASLQEDPQPEVLGAPITVSRRCLGVSARVAGGHRPYRTAVAWVYVFLRAVHTCPETWSHPWSVGLSLPHGRDRSRTFPQAPAPGRAHARSPHGRLSGPSGVTPPALGAVHRRPQARSAHRPPERFGTDDCASDAGVRNVQPPVDRRVPTRRRIRRERDRGATGELARHRRTRGDKSATVSDSASGARDDDRDGSS